MSMREFWCCLEALNPQESDDFVTDTNFFNSTEIETFKDMKIISQRKRVEAHG